MIKNIKEMNKRKASIVGGALIVAVLLVGGIVWATTRGASHHSTPVAQSTSTTINQATPPGATSEQTTASTTTTTSKAEPTVYKPRTPVKCERSGKANGDFPSDDPNGAKRWVTVAHLSGACDGVTQQFSLKGTDTRLAWRSDDGSFAAFLLGQGGLDDTAGYADAECFGACNDHQALVDGPGDFKLQVQATSGPWEVEVQEYR